MLPSTYQSGQLDNCYGHMEKRGSRYLWYTLYNASKYVCKCDESFGSYLAQKRSKGKHYNIALSHAVRKLVRLIFAMENQVRRTCPLFNSLCKQLLLDHLKRCSHCHAVFKVLRIVF